ncbi:hypothetical protein [uncultured Azonexus sp.]|uniref:capsular polysaccharide export protein, LipB/KpsS family n=1 Tax=uncultured Azonexus sp. TaxID=520307 RepID=UPI0026085355|nr:hypothetical protein [uncultured Azonexus sp.]
MRFFSPDSLHVNRKNFQSIHDFMEEGKHEYVQYSKLNHLIAKYGDYRKMPSEISAENEVYSQFDFSMLLEAQVHGINLFDVCRLELLSYLAADLEFAKYGKVFTKNNVFQFAFDKHRSALILNISAAAFWIKHWRKYLETAPVYDGALIFSGSLIYSRSLIELLKLTPTRVFILETFFTGNDYYCEERFSSLPNASLLSSRNYYDAIFVESDTWEKDRAKAINKYILSDNLNVKQPAPTGRYLFDADGFVLVIGQVVNDFSIIGYHGGAFSSIAIYSEFIQKLLDKSDKKIVFKAHPWENKKTNLKSPVTADFLRENFSDYLGSRLLIVEDHSLEELFDQSNCVVIINSQSGIEAAWHGIKPITLGEPFFGNKGFTIDFDVNHIDQAVEHVINHNREAYSLTLDEFDRFELFLVKSLVYSLVSKNKSGLIQLRKIFAPFDYIKLSIKGKPSVENNMIAAPEVISKTVSDRGGNNMLENVAATNQITLTSFERKWRKFKRDPKRFFADSKNPLLRQIAKLC